jgi:hypothetical protein
MQVSSSTLLLGAVILAAGSFALGRETSPAEPPRIIETRPDVPLEPGSDMEGTDPAAATENPHAMPGGSMNPGPDDEPPAIAWTVPAAWHTLPNPSSMRIATYGVPHATGDTADAEVSVSRAGGDMASNIDRWTGQFQGAGPARQQAHAVKGMTVTVVEIEGTYTNGMDPSAKPKTGWALLAAIVKTPGMPYFFKMTGPAATVHGAKAVFTAMIDGIQPKGGAQL